MPLIFVERHLLSLPNLGPRRHLFRSKRNVKTCAGTQLPSPEAGCQYCCHHCHTGDGGQASSQCGPHRAGPINTREKCGAGPVQVCCEDMTWGGMWCGNPSQCCVSAEPGFALSRDVLVPFLGQKAKKVE